MCTDVCRKRITCTVTRVTVFCQQIKNGNIANQIHGFTIDYGKFILIIRQRIQIFLNPLSRVEKNKSAMNSITRRRENSDVFESDDVANYYWVLQ